MCDAPSRALGFHSVVRALGTARVLAVLVDGILGIEGLGILMFLSLSNPRLGNLGAESLGILILLTLSARPLIPGIFLSSPDAFPLISLPNALAVLPGFLSLLDHFFHHFLHLGILGSLN